MNIQSIHQHIHQQLQKLNEQHQDLFSKAPLPAGTDLENFLTNIRNLYESALRLRHESDIHSMEQLELAIAENLKEAASMSKIQPMAVASVLPKPIENAIPPVATAVPTPTVPEPLVETPQPAATINMEKIIADVSVLNVQDPPKGELRNRKKTDLHEQYEEMPTLAHRFEGKETHAERIAHQSSGSKRLSENLGKKAVRDLKAAIGINEKFQFINHLFNGDAIAYHKAIDELNLSHDYPTACKFIQQNYSESYQWDQSSATAEVFMKLLERRFMA